VFIIILLLLSDEFTEYIVIGKVYCRFKSLDSTHEKHELFILIFMYVPCLKAQHEVVLHIFQYKYLRISQESK